MVEPQKREVMNQGGLECGFWIVWGERARATTSLEQEAFVFSSVFSFLYQPILAHLIPARVLHSH